MSKEAMKLALEALEDIGDEWGFTSQRTVPKRKEAITALREALAEQPAQKCSYPYCGCSSKAWCKVERNEALDKMAENARELGLDYEPEQEPVAWEGGEGWESLAWELCANENGEDSCNELIWEGGPIPEPWGDRWMKYEEEAKRLIALVQKHTTPPQRTWVGLTPEELDEMFRKTLKGKKLVNWVARAIEAKLKEKNNG